jgi:hypothetical protein
MNGRQELLDARIDCRRAPNSANVRLWKVFSEEPIFDGLGARLRCEGCRATSDSFLERFDVRIGSKVSSHPKLQDFWKSSSSLQPFYAFNPNVIRTLRMVSHLHIGLIFDDGTKTCGQGCSSRDWLPVWNGRLPVKEFSTGRVT